MKNLVITLAVTAVFGMTGNLTEARAEGTLKPVGTMTKTKKQSQTAQKSGEISDNNANSIKPQPKPQNGIGTSDQNRRLS